VQKLHAHASSFRAMGTAEGNFTPSEIGSKPERFFGRTSTEPTDRM
jgi:hypothetical protein